MRHGAKDRLKTLEDIRKFVRIVREKTINGFVLSGSVFKGTKNEKTVPLHIECEISNENSLGIFILANFLHVDDSRGTYKRGKFVKWCGPENLSIAELTDKFIKVRDEHKKTRFHRKDENIVVKIVLPVKVSPVENIIEIQSSESNLLTQEFVPMSKEEFRKTIYGGPKEVTTNEMLPMLNEIYKHTKYIPKTIQEVFRIEVPRNNGILEVIDIRDLFVVKENDPRNSILGVKLMVSLNILEKNDKYYHWIAGKPTAEMVDAICTEFAYLNYVTKCRREFFEAKTRAEETEKIKKVEEERITKAEAERARIAKEEAEVIAEIEAEIVAEASEEIKPNLHETVFEISEETTPIDYDKFTAEELVIVSEQQLSILIFQKLLKIEKRLKIIEDYQEKQSKNLVTVADILGKSIV